MSQGGPRPDAGRKQKYHYFVKGKEFDSLKDAAKANGVTLPTVHRWCTGKRDDCWREEIGAGEKSIPPPGGGVPEDIKDEAAKKRLTPLDYMLNIMNDEGEDKETRIRCGYYALPYVHGKASEKKGKKEIGQDKAEKAGGGKFGTAKPPALKRVK